MEVFKYADIIASIKDADHNFSLDKTQILSNKLEDGHKYLLLSIGGRGLKTALVFETHILFTKNAREIQKITDIAAFLEADIEWDMLILSEMPTDTWKETAEQLPDTPNFWKLQSTKFQKNVIYLASERYLEKLKKDFNAPVVIYVYEPYFLGCLPIHSNPMYCSYNKVARIDVKKNNSISFAWQPYIINNLELPKAQEPSKYIKSPWAAK